MNEICQGGELFWVSWKVFDFKRGQSFGKKNENDSKKEGEILGKEKNIYF